MSGDVERLNNQLQAREKKFRSQKKAKKKQTKNKKVIKVLSNNNFNNIVIKLCMCHCQ